MSVNKQNIDLVQNKFKFDISDTVIVELPKETTICTIIGRIRHNNVNLYNVETLVQDAGGTVNESNIRAYTTLESLCIPDNSLDDLELEWNKQHEHFCTQDNNNNQTILLNTLKLSMTLGQDDINIEEVRAILKDGIDYYYRDYRGYSLTERAGLIGRLDLVDLISRSQYSEI